MHHYDTLIVGAGAAGLMAALELARQGKHVGILEARDRIGGRIHTLPPGNFSIPAEAGAEFVHGDLPLTMSLLKEANIGTRAMTGKFWSIEQGKLSESRMFDEHWDELIEALKQLDHDTTMAAFLREHFQNEKHRPLVEMVTRFVEGYDAADLDKVSAIALRDEWTSDDDFTQYHINGGYRGLVEYLRQQCEHYNVTFHLLTQAQTVQWKQGHVVILTNKSRFEANRALVTVPIGVLASGTIDFDPPIPDHLAAVRDVGFGGVIKFLVEFNRAFWEVRNDSFRHIPSLGFVFADATIPTWWSQLPTQTPLLTGWLAGPAAQRAQQSYDADSDLLKTLAYIFQCPEAELQKEIKHYAVANWLDDPFARGAYAYRTTETQAALAVLSEPISDTLYFAGEAIYEGPEMGTVEAALASGKAAAGRMRD